MGWAIAVHGGAGVDPCLSMERQQEAKDLLLHCLNLGVFAPAIDVVELLVRNPKPVNASSSFLAQLLTCPRL